MPTTSRTFEREAMATMIRRCAELHMRQIARGGDPFETGSARPLDYGHWSAHKLESLTRHHVRHGEAVAIGMALDARYSVTAACWSQARRSAWRCCWSIWASDLWHAALETTGPRGHVLLEACANSRSISGAS
jgi:3-dehydroquinate synthase